LFVGSTSERCTHVQSAGHHFSRSRQSAPALPPASAGASLASAPGPGPARRSASCPHLPATRHGYGCGSGGSTGAAAGARSPRHAAPAARLPSGSRAHPPRPHPRGYGHSDGRPWDGAAPCGPPAQAPPWSDGVPCAPSTHRACRHAASGAPVRQGGGGGDGRSCPSAALGTDRGGREHLARSLQLCYHGDGASPAAFPTPHPPTERLRPKNIGAATTV
jgi:hypothetical protein